MVRTQAKKTSHTARIFQGLRYAPVPRVNGAPSEGQPVAGSAANNGCTSTAQTSAAPASTINQRSIRGSRVAKRRCP